MYIEWNYIWVVKSADERRKKNLGFYEESWDLVVIQNPETKEKRILLKPNFTIDKILIVSENVILVDTQWKEYKLENY